MGFTRPDITYVIQKLSQFVHALCQAHWNVSLHVLRYLKGCLSKGLIFPSSHSLKLQAYCDVDWASYTLTGYCIFFASTLIYWKTKKQTIM